MASETSSDRGERDGLSSDDPRNRSRDKEEVDRQRCLDDHERHGERKEYVDQKKESVNVEIGSKMLSERCGGRGERDGLSSDDPRNRARDKEEVDRQRCLDDHERHGERKEYVDQKKESVNVEIGSKMLSERCGGRGERDGLSSDDPRNRARDKEKVDCKRRIREEDINFNQTDYKRQKFICITEESTDIDLLKEYLQWDLINNELYEKCAEIMSVRGPRQRQELTNTIQRWLVHINEQYNRVPKYEWFCLLPSVTVDHSAAIFLRDAFLEKWFVNDRYSADKAIERLFGFIRDKHKSIEEKYGQNSTDDRALLHLEFDPGRQLVVVEKFHSKELTRLVPLVKKGGLLNTARLLLRYESFGNGSYQWGQHQEVHQVFYEKFRVRFEGFASPLNSRFIECSDTRFCSLFPDTDSSFGSLGDFFRVNFDKYQGGWSLNPPFVNDVMLQVAKTIEAVLDKGPHWWFFCLFPYWDDDDGWIMLNKSKHLLKRFDLKPRSFAIQDAYGKEIWPTMMMNLFVLGMIPPGPEDIWASLEKVLVRYRPR